MSRPLSQSRRALGASLLALLALTLGPVVGCNSSSGGGGSSTTTTPDGGSPPGDDPLDPAPPGGDSQEIVVVSSDPAPFQQDALAGQDIVVTFSDSLDTGTVRPEAVRVTGSSTGRIAATVELLDDDRTLRIDPSRAFLAGEEITVALRNSLSGPEGKPFSGEVFGFRARSAAHPPSSRRQEVFTAIGIVDWIATADLDLDGAEDLLHTVAGGSTIDLLGGNSTGGFEPGERIELMQPANAVAVADLDSDGDLDVLVGTRDRARLFMNLQTADGDGAATIEFESTEEVPTGSAVHSIAVGEIDHRGRPDVVLATDRGIEVRLGGVENSPAATLGDEHVVGSNLVLADVDVDGHLDLVFAHTTEDAVLIYPGTGDATVPFAEPVSVSTPLRAEQLSAADLQADGAPEILALATGSDGGVTLFMISSGANGFTAAAPFAEVASTAPAADTGELPPARCAVADIGGDGRLDITVAAPASGEVLTFHNIGGVAPFGGAPEVLVRLPEPRTTAVADLDGDGILDIVATSGTEIHSLLALEGEPPPPGSEPLLAIDPLEVPQGTGTAFGLVRLSTPEPIEGFTTVVGFDASVVSPRGENLAGTVTAASDPEFTSFSINEAESYLVYAVLVDFLPPLEGRVIPAGSNQLLFRFEFSVPVTATTGEYSFDFLSEAGEPPMETSLVINTANVIPRTESGTLRIVPDDGSSPPSGSDSLRLTSVELLPGDEGIVDVIGSFSQEADGFTVIAGVDPAQFEVLDLELAPRLQNELQPELVIPKIDAVAGTFVVTVIFDFLPPFDRQSLPPGADQHLISARIRAADDTVNGEYSVSFVNGVGDPPLNNIFVYSGQSIFPELSAGRILVGEESQEVRFIRGDYDGNGSVDLTDAVAISNYLFLQGVAPQCLDAADADDDGSINITDSVLLLNFLGGLGDPPPPPYPSPGVDPSEDDLECS